jgi:beta-glucanase (GH16 family)
MKMHIVRFGFGMGLLFGSAVAEPAPPEPAARAPAPPALRMPTPAQAAGFTQLIFNSDFANVRLSDQLSCAGTPQTAPWKQGLWWEGQNNSAGVAPCSQITINYDPESNQNVLDLRWTATGNTDPYHATTISTYPLDTVSPHFAFRHGYVEVVARATPMATGVWAAIWAWSDNQLIGVNTPPHAGGMPASEMDIMEAYGPTGSKPSGMDAALHEYYNPQVSTYLINAYPAPVDVTKLHTYGWLWTSNGKQWQGGSVCLYIDNISQACKPTTAASEAQQMFLILSMGVGCNYNYSDLSCLNGLSRADLLVSRVTVYGAPTNYITP